MFEMRGLGGKCPLLEIVQLGGCGDSGCLEIEVGHGANAICPTITLWSKCGMNIVSGKEHEDSFTGECIQYCKW